MGLNVARARARTQSSQHMSVDAYVDKDPQQHASSGEPTFISTAVVPAHETTEILSSLINSLTVLSDSARDHLTQAKELEFAIQSTAFPDPYDDPFPSTDHLDHTSLHNATLAEPGDEDVAEAPVVGYAKGQARTPKKSVKDRWITHRSGKSTDLGFSQRDSGSRLRAPSALSVSTMGMPSIERPSTRLSRSSIEHANKSPYKTWLRLSDEQERSTAPSVKDIDVRSVRTSRSRQSGRLLKEAFSRTKTPESQLLVTAADISHNEREHPNTSPGKSSYNPLDPSNRDALQEHLVPSRRSSVRQSPGKASTVARSPSSKRTRSPSMRSTTTPVVEDDSIEEQDPTLRRIRELQRAKEQRQLERMKESKLEKLSKRVASASSRSIRQKSVSQSSYPPENAHGTQSVAGPSPYVLPSKDGARSNPVTVPIIQNLPASPVSSESASRSSPRRLAPTKGGLYTAPPSPHSHKRAFSGSLRRSGSIRRSSTAEVKSVTEQVDAFLAAPRLTQRIKHPRTNRTIAFSEVGDPEGFVVFVCVGMGLTRYVTSFYDDVARTQKLRLITPDRPGTGESDPYSDTLSGPLAWADDVTVICHSLNIQKFSLLAHSAGTIYALAIALKMPTYVKIKIHLLAPWIPPSQMVTTGSTNVKTANLPTAHRLLSKLPTQFLRAANSRFLAATSASMDSNSSRKRDKNSTANYETLLRDVTGDIAASALPSLGTPPGRTSVLSYHEANLMNGLAPSLSPSPIPGAAPHLSPSGTRSRLTSPTPPEGLSPQARQALFNSTLTKKTWALATANANPANDLIVCLERRRTVGFFYRDVTRGVVIHHGRHDARVPLENVRWLETDMKRCELRILDNEGHGLMASAKVMSEVLGEIGHEWEEWDLLARDKERRKKTREAEKEKAAKEDRTRFIRTGQY